MKQGMKALMIVMVFNIVLITPSSTYADGQNSIVGKMIFKGNPNNYVNTIILTSRDSNCSMVKEKINFENVIINKNGNSLTLKNVIISIKSGLGDKKFPRKPGNLTLTQFGCQFEPHVLAGQLGQSLIVINNDNTNHNPVFWSEVNEPYNFTQPRMNLIGKTLKLKAEAPFKITCDVHPWMSCYLAVFNHPFFDVTGKEGTFTLSGMPDGNFTIEAWHETFGTVSAKVSVSGNKTVTQDLTFAPPPKSE